MKLTKSQGDKIWAYFPASIHLLPNTTENNLGPKRRMMIKAGNAIIVNLYISFFRRGHISSPALWACDIF